MPPLLELRGITKTFPGVLANDRIDLTLHEGEILALLGENGAGKTTLMNILYGLYTPDAGEIRVRGEPVSIHDPNDAIRQGIGMVHQHFMLVPVFTVTENVMLGVEPVKAGLFLDRNAAAARVREISDRFGLRVPPDARIEDLPVGIQQRVEIIKILYREADILILDEPTAVLTPQEAEGLFQIIHSLIDQGKSVVFITHKLKEVLAIADRITVLRNGRVVGTTTPGEATEASLAKMMVGREVILRADKKPAQPGRVVLDVQDLRVVDDRGATAVDGVSFQVQAGEVLGVAGVQGNGQTELVEALTGLRRVKSGQATILGHDTTHAPPRAITRLGVAHVPEDRQRDGLVLSFPVADNLVLNTYYVPPFAGIAAWERKHPHPPSAAPPWLVGAAALPRKLLAWLARGILQRGEIEKAARERVAAFDVRTPSIFIPTSHLSGGNQQKVIIAREFSRPIELMIASQPTRGLDVGSIEYIHGRILEKRDDGCAVLLVSPELDEIMSLSDRIAVMYRGQMVAILPAEEATKEQLGLLMAGFRESGSIS